MNDDAYLAAIRANLDDDAPRLVYADVLQERGDPRGELIVVQCARERLEREGRRLGDFRALLQREREILGAHVKSWVNPFGLRSWWGEFHRGFITRLSITIMALEAKWELFRTLPLESIAIRHSRRGLPLLGQLAWLANHETSARTISIETLASNRAEFDAPTLLELLDGVDPANTDSTWDHWLPHSRLLPALRGLRIHDPTRMHIQAVAGADLALREFHFNVGTPILAADMNALVESPSLAGVEDLWAGFLEDEAALALFRARSLPALRTLGVTRTGRSLFPPDVGAAFAEATFTEPLVSFRSDLMLDPNVIRALEPMSALTSLTLDREPDDFGAVATLLAGPVASRLRSLTLTGHARQSAAVVVATPFDRLDELTLQRFWMSVADAHALPDLFAFHALECEYQVGAQDVLHARWPFGRRTERLA